MGKKEKSEKSEKVLDAPQEDPGATESNVEKSEKPDKIVKGDGAPPKASGDVDDHIEEIRQLKDENMKLKTDVANITKERDNFGQELEKVKANLKQHLTSNRAAGGGHEAEL